MCIDKTGTITNETMILEYYMDILGNDSKMVLNYAYLNSFYHSGIRNPIDEAVLKCSEMPDKQDYYETLTETYQKKDEIPFDYERKCVSVLIEDQKGRQELVLKGEPDAVLKCCDRVEYQNQILPIQDDAKKNMDEIRNAGRWNESHCRSEKRDDNYRRNYLCGRKPYDLIRLSYIL